MTECKSFAVHSKAEMGSANSSPTRMTLSSTYRGSQSKSVHDIHSAPIPTHSKYENPSWLEVLLRAAGLSILWNVACSIRNTRVEEKPKQAMYKSRLVVSLTLMPHILPLSAAVVLMVLNLRGYYIGGNLAGAGTNDVKLSGVQFAAKLHELMMQASLSMIVVGFIRYELALGKEIPFRAIFGSVQFSNITYLWSREFSGTIKARCQSKRAKWGLVLLLVIASLLFVTVGPSSAILMRPRLDDWPTGGTELYLNATREDIWPTFLDETDIPSDCSTVSLSTDCISKDWPVIPRTLLPFWPGMTTMPQTIQVPCAKSMKLLNTAQTIGVYKEPWTLATIQMSNLADAVSEIGRLWINAASGNGLVAHPTYSGRFEHRKDVTYSIDKIQQPLTMVTCLANRNFTEPGLAARDFLMPNITSACDSRPSTAVTYNSFKGYHWLKSILANFDNSTSDEPQLQFGHLPDSMFGSNSIGALVTFPDSWPSGANVLACAIDARWVPASISSRQLALKVVTGQTTSTSWADEGTCFHPGSRRITLTPEWAGYLNPVIKNYNRTVFHEILNGVPLTNLSLWENDNEFVQPLVESILSIMVTTGLASNKASATRQGVLKGCTSFECEELCRDGNGAWCNAIMPKGEFGYDNNSIYDLSEFFDISKAARFEARVKINGYAYAYDGRWKTVFVSCAVLCLYCLLVLCHISFSIYKGLSSQSWDTISEIVALVMQSKGTTKLENTCAGITTTSIFANIVAVVEADDDPNHLELSFEADNVGQVLRRKLELDKFYQ